MKIALAALLFLVVLSFENVHAAKPTAASSDRIEFAPGLYGITHTENFEYVCDVETKEGAGTVKYKTFLDVDFEQGTGYRFAAGFVGGGSVAGMFAAEFEVLSATKARCPGLCLALQIKDDGYSTATPVTNSIEFKEDPTTNVITIAFLEKGVSSVVGTCQKNEIE